MLASDAAQLVFQRLPWFRWVWEITYKGGDMFCLVAATFPHLRSFDTICCYFFSLWLLGFLAVSSVCDEFGISVNVSPFPSRRVGPLCLRFCSQVLTHQLNPAVPTTHLRPPCHLPDIRPSSISFYLQGSFIRTHSLDVEASRVEA